VQASRMRYGQSPNFTQKNIKKILTTAKHRRSLKIAGGDRYDRKFSRNAAKSGEPMRSVKVWKQNIKDDLVGKIESL
jgi:hypothetical protein